MWWVSRFCKRLYLTITSSSYGLRYCWPWALSFIEGRPRARWWSVEWETLPWWSARARYDLGTPGGTPCATIPPHEQFRVGPGNATLKPRLYSRVGEYQVLMRSPIRWRPLKWPVPGWCYRGAGGLDIHFSSDGHARPVRPSPEVSISGLPRAAIYLTSTSKFSL